MEWVALVIAAVSLAAAVVFAVRLSRANAAVARFEVSYVTTGGPRPLPIGAGLVLYRVVQEALTNVLKHAGPGPQA